MRSPVFLIALLAVIALYTQGRIIADEEPSPTVTFVKFHDALVFIDQKLDKDDWKALGDSLYPPLREYQPDRSGNWPQLKRERGEHRLADLFAGREFPKNSDVYTFTASPTGDSPLRGWSVTRFVKTDKGWRITAMYGLR